MFKFDLFIFQTNSIRHKDLRDKGLKIKRCMPKLVKLSNKLHEIISELGKFEMYIFEIVLRDKTIQI